MTILMQIEPNTFLNYLLLAYGVMWVIAFGYVLSLVWQQRNLKRDIDLINRLLEEEGEFDE